MIYEFRLVVVSTYEEAVPFASHALRLAPRSQPGQLVLRHGLEVEPWPAERREGMDFFGNATVWVAFDAADKRLVARSSGRVEVTAQPWVDAETTPAWESIAALAVADRSTAPHAPAHMLFPSRIVTLEDDIRDYAAKSFSRNRPVLEGCIELMQRIHADFTYDSDATNVTTPPAEAFALKRGVCQDFAHVMIAGMRGLGLPAGYVSGLLRTLPPAGQPRLEGVDSTHAWVRVWCGPETGWIALDPTNALIVAEDHVTMGIGRDYADVAPIDGVIVTSGAQALEVAVDVAVAG